MKRFAVVIALSAMILGVAAPALACGGLVAPNGTVNLLKTTTAVGYSNGVEHYITGFEFAGGGGEFGSIIPLPDVPTRVIRGGDWTLQRLVQEVQPPIPASFDDGEAFATAGAPAEVLLETRIDALDITVLKGGGDEVGTWARENGFLLPPDAPEVLDFYAERSPIFAAAKFDADAARELGQNVGDSTPIHFVIPTDDPWVPLRILALGRTPGEIVEADVFLLTPDEPNLLPGPTNGMDLAVSEPASDLLLSDLGSDEGMAWIDESGMWLSYLDLAVPAEDLRFDLAIDAAGTALPSAVDAGFLSPGGIRFDGADGAGWWFTAIVAVMVAAAIVTRRRGMRRVTS